MSDLDQLDELQKVIAQAKFAFLFKKICGVYNTPSTTQNIVNQGIAFKIAREYSPIEGYLQSERNKIAQELSQINFTLFFSNNKSSQQKDRRAFFALKTPKSFLSSKSANQANYIRYVLKKYCHILTSEKLSEIYHSTIALQLSAVHAELKNTIYDIVSERSSMLNKMSAFFDTKEVKRDINIAKHLKNLIFRSKFTIKDSDLEKSKKLEINFIQSYASRQK